MNVSVLHPLAALASVMLMLLGTASSSGASPCRHAPGGAASACAEMAPGGQGGAGDCAAAADERVEAAFYGEIFEQADDEEDRCALL